MPKKISDVASEIINSFDTRDLLATLGAINLSFDNQNKNYATSYFSTYILFNQNSQKPKASRKTLQRLVIEINGSGIIPIIQDPPEAPFFQKVSFDKDYFVFNGVDHHAAFFVSRLCEFLLVKRTYFSKDFMTLLGKIVKIGLSISNNICSSLNFKYEDIKEYHGDKPIFLPGNIEYLKQHLYIDKSEIYKLGLGEEDIQRHLVFHYMPTLNLTKCLEKEIPYYFNRPFLDCGDRLLLIDPTAINTFLRYTSIELSKLFDCKDSFIDSINELFFNWGEMCIRKNIMNYFNQDLSLSSIKCTEASNYKDSIIQFSNSKIIVYSACFGNEFEGKPNKIDLDKYLLSIKKQLDSLPTKYDVFSVVLLFTYGSDLYAGESKVFHNGTLLFAFDEFESFVINEKNKPCSLFNLLNFIDSTKSQFPSTMGTVNRLAFLSAKDYDFYFDDNIDAYSTNLFVGFEFTYQYRTQASKQEEFCMRKFFNQFLLLEKDNDNLYFVNPVFIENGSVLTFNKNEDGGFWVYSRYFDNNLSTFIGMINYWLTDLKDELKNVINNVLYIEVSDNKNSNKIVEKNKNICLINIHPIIDSLDTIGKFNEIELVKMVLQQFGLLTNHINDLLKNSLLNERKRYNMPIKSDEIMLIPFKKSLRPVFVSKYLSSLFDDSIGREYAITDCGFEPGCTIKDGDTFLKSVVAKLFNKLDECAKNFNWRASVLFMYEYQEDYLQKILMNKKNLKVKYSLYSGHHSEINDIYFKLNSVSPCVRFLIQYFSTLQYEGQEIMDETDLELLVTLVNRMIHFANIDDGIVFKLLSNEISLLKSKRIDADLTNLQIFSDFIAKEMINDITGENIDLNDGGLFPLKKELNDAYLSEYGFTFDQLTKVIGLLIAIGQEQDNEIKTVSIKEIIKRCNDYKIFEIIGDEQTILRAIDHLSLVKRAEFFDQSIGNFRELYPWRYNRTESLIRKPLIRDGERLIWGNRTLYESSIFIIEHIYNGSEPINKNSGNKIKNLNGKILALKGQKFNDLVYEYLQKTIPEMEFFKNIKSFNNKRMNDKRGNFLGDIDVLGIDKNKKKIILIEVKNYHYSKNMAEFGFELTEFLGTDEKKGFVQKELARMNWVKENINDVKKSYKLDDGEWSVAYTFLSEKPLLCSVFRKLTFNNISLKQINYKYLKGLKS